MIEVDFGFVCETGLFEIVIAKFSWIITSTTANIENVMLSANNTIDTIDLWIWKTTKINKWRYNYDLSQQQTNSDESYSQQIPLTMSRTMIPLSSRIWIT